MKGIGQEKKAFDQTRAFEIMLLVENSRMKEQQ